MSNKKQKKQKLFDDFHFHYNYDNIFESAFSECENFEDRKEFIFDFISDFISQLLIIDNALANDDAVSASELSSLHSFYTDFDFLARIYNIEGLKKVLSRFIKESSDYIENAE